MRHTAGLAAQTVSTGRRCGQGRQGRSSRNAGVSVVLQSPASRNIFLD